MASPSEEHYVGQLLTSTNGVVEREAVRKLLISLLTEGQSDIEVIKISGDLIKYLRDNVLTSLAAIRRAAANQARTQMSPDEIVTATGLSKATVSRLITERRNY